jgi:Uma2 family endonuclease
VTFSEYVSYQAPFGFRDELIDGKVVLSPSANRRHADLCCRIYDLLKERLNTSFVVRLDTTHHLGDREGPRPDVFVIGRERWIAADQTNGFPEGSPELAIEVLSPSNTGTEMSTKRDLYLSDPRCLEVWEVDEERQEISRYTRQEKTEYSLADSILVPSKIGHGSISLAAIFAGIVGQ